MSAVPVWGQPTWNDLVLPQKQGKQWGSDATTSEANMAVGVALPEHPPHLCAGRSGANPEERLGSPRSKNEVRARLGPKRTLAKESCANNFSEIVFFHTQNNPVWYHSNFTNVKIKTLTCWLFSITQSKFESKPLCLQVSPSALYPSKRFRSAAYSSSLCPRPSEQLKKYSWMKC